MPCCKIEQYQWCRKAPLAEYRDSSGNEYCIFHAPQGKKIINGVTLSVSDFNDFVFDRISGTSKNGVCNLSGVVFEGDVDFRRYHFENPLPGLKLINAIFSGKAIFLKVHFGRHVDFSESTFIREVSFVGAMFNSVTKFDTAKFKANTYFDKATFHDRVTFQSTTFEGETSFRGSHFDNEVYFNRTLFYKFVRFKKAEFDDHTQFMAAQFRDSVWMDESAFAKKVIFSDSIFHEEAFLRNVKIREAIWTVNTIFSRKVSFIASHIQYGLFNGELFLDEGLFRGLVIGDRIMFNGCNIRKVSYFATDLRKVDFVNCCWPRSMGRYGRPILYDEKFIYPGRKKYPITIAPFKLLSASVRDTIIPIRRKSAEKIELQYRLLKQKYKEEHNETEASNWHYNEKNIFRISNPFRRYLPSLTTLYWLSSGYGERPVRAGIVLLLLFFSLTAGFAMLGGLTVSSNVIDLQQDYLSIPLTQRIYLTVINNTRFATFQRDTPLITCSLQGEFIKTLVQTIIPVQLTLFVLAIRNRFRR